MCLYTTASGAVYALTGAINWIVPLFITGSSLVRDQRTQRVGKQFTLVVLGLYLFCWQFALYLLQTALRVQRPDPFCPEMLTDGFPSGAAFYTAAGGTLALMLAWLLNFSYSWISWATLAVWWVVPPAVLIWFGFNVWQEVLVSLCVGALAVLIFFMALRYHVKPWLPYILLVEPWYSMGCIDTWVMDERESSEAEWARAMLERRSRSSRRE